MKITYITALSFVLLAGISFGQQVLEKDKLKEQSIKSNPQNYIKQGGTLEDAGIMAPAKVKISQEQGFQIAAGEKMYDPNRERVILTDQSSFPKFVDTGNAKHDNKVYADAKKIWIAENYDLYKTISNTKEVSHDEFLKAIDEKKKTNPENN